MRKYQLERICELRQEEWSNHMSTGQWTKELLPLVYSAAPLTTFWISLMLTGHGPFGAYLFRFKRRENPECWHCGHPYDDAEHALFYCTLHGNKRPPINLLKQPKSNEFKGFVTLIMKSRWDYKSNKQRGAATQN